MRGSKLMFRRLSDFIPLSQLSPSNDTGPLVLSETLTLPSVIHLSFTVCPSVIASPHQIHLWNFRAFLRVFPGPSEHFTAQRYGESGSSSTLPLAFLSLLPLFWLTSGLDEISPPAMCPNPSLRSVAQSCPTLCDPMNRSTPGLSVHHQLPEFTNGWKWWHNLPSET